MPKSVLLPCAPRTSRSCRCCRLLSRNLLHRLIAIRIDNNPPVNHLLLSSDLWPGNEGLGLVPSESTSLESHNADENESYCSIGHISLFVFVVKERVKKYQYVGISRQYHWQHQCT